MAGLVQLYLAGFLVQRIVAFLNNNFFFVDTFGFFFNLTLEQGNQAVNSLVQLRAVFCLPGNDQRSTGFVNQN